MTTIVTPTAEQLREIVALHRKWYFGEAGGARADLGGANLRNADLRNANLGDANLRNADLGDANLGNANLRNANLGDANLGGADLRNADLGDANLGGADLRNADLRNANLGGANLGNADLGGANLGGANLRNADLGGANLGNADLGDANLGDNAVLPDGVVWKSYVDELVPALLMAGGRALDDMARPAIWDCHSWENCPMAEAFGVHSLALVPPLYRAHANQFIAFYDGQVAPLNDLAALRERWGLAPLDADAAAPTCQV